MKHTLAIATIAIIGAAGQPTATAVGMPLARRSPSVALTRVAANPRLRTDDDGIAARKREPDCGGH